MRSFVEGVGWVFRWGWDSGGRAFGPMGGGKCMGGLGRRVYRAILLEFRGARSSFSRNPVAFIFSSVSLSLELVSGEPQFPQREKKRPGSPEVNERGSGGRTRCGLENTRILYAC